MCMCSTCVHCVGVKCVYAGGNLWVQCVCGLFVCVCSVCVYGICVYVVCVHCMHMVCVCTGCGFVSTVYCGVYVACVCGVCVQWV